MRIVFIALNQGNIIALFCQWIEAKFTLVKPPLDNGALFRIYEKQALLIARQAGELSFLSLFDLRSFDEFTKPRL